MIDDITGAIHTISLGAGVQSSVMALMASRGELEPMPVAAIFADVGDEPDAVYEWLGWLEKRLVFPVLRVGNAEPLSIVSTRLRTSKKSGNTYLSPSVPAFTTLNGKKGMLRRQCTRDFKINWVRRATKMIMKEYGVGHSIQWIGISTDEATRMAASRDAKITNTWPLIETGVSRAACLEWARRNNIPEPPRSACVFCPYHGDSEWIRLRDEFPQEFRKAVDYENKLRTAVRTSTALKADGVFLHSSRVPLAEVVFSEGLESSFSSECVGMCGV